MTTAPVQLRADDLADPCGLPLHPPRLRWLCTDSRTAEVQSASQIQAASSLERLELVPDLWDSGKVDGGGPDGIEYGGRGVTPGAVVFWRVRSFDSDGEAGAWSQPAQFEFAIAPGDWCAPWIAAPMRGAREQSPPVPLLRRRFRVGFVPVRARLHIAVAGACRIWINETELDLPEVPSGFTDYRVRIASRTFRVDGLVRNGAGSITVLLGDGFYSGYADGRSREHFGTRPELSLQLEVESATGDRCTITSDEHWEWRTSPLLCADITTGAAIDGRAFGHHPEYARQKRQWQPVDVLERPERVQQPIAWTGVLQQPEPVAGRIVQRGPTESGESRWWVEFPTTLFGRPVLTLKGAEGCFVRVRYGHLTDHRGQPVFDQELTDHCTLSGDGPREVISFPFTRRLFRHLEITGDADAQALIAVEARCIGIAAAEQLRIDSDHPLIERLAQRFRRTVDFLLQEQPWRGVAPTRRHASLADLYPVLGPLCLHSDVRVPLQLWLDEMLASETQASMLPETVPPLRTVKRTSGIGTAHAPVTEDDPVPETGGAEFLPALALEMFRHYGNKRMLEPVFTFARRLVFSLEKSCPDLIRQLPGGAHCRSTQHAALLGTALFHECVENTARIGELIGLKSQAESFRALADRIRTAFRQRFVTPDGWILPDDQDARVAALAFGLLTDETATSVFDRLCKDLIRSGYRCDTHPLLGARLLDVLTRGGREDLAWLVALRVDGSSWLGAADDATDVLTGNDGDLTLRDAALIRWLVESAAGFAPDISIGGDGAGFTSTVIEPRLPIGELFPEGAPVRRLAMHAVTAAGEWRVSWQIRGHSAVLNVTVPCGGNARLVFPDGAVKRLVAGVHEFRIGADAGNDDIPLLSETL